MATSARGAQRLFLLAAVIVAALSYAGVDALELSAGQELRGEWRGWEWALAEPKLLWALMVLPWLWAVAAFGLSDLPIFQQALSTLVRAALVSLLVLALADLAVVHHEKRVATVLLADVSASVPDAFLRASERYARAVRDAHPEQPVELITFAKQPKAVPIPEGPEAFLERHKESSPGTDIEAAVKMAYSLFPPDHAKRLIILSDGLETEGDVLAEAPNAAEQEVEIAFADIEIQRPVEVLVQRASLPPHIEIEAPFQLQLDVFASQAGEARLELWQDDYKQGPGRKIPLQKGVQTLNLPVTVHEPGFKKFRVRLSPGPGQDTNPHNNSAEATAVVAGNPRVLYVEGEPSSARYLAGALRAQSIDVEVRGPHGVPHRLEDLERYDMFILSDVAAKQVSARQMRLIRRYVRDLGGGFLMAGGENSFGLGGYHGTDIEKLLPVRFETEKQRKTPSLAIALLVDKSGSMAGQKISLAKDAAQATVELLERADQVAVLAFDSSLQPLVRLQSARNRVRILSQISRLAAGGGTNIRPALTEAYRQLRPAEARLKHVILLSDGQSPPTGVLELVQDMAGDQITISTVAVGNGADRNLLNSIAELGGGRAYFTNDPFNIPKIFTKETRTVTRNALIEQPFRPRRGKKAQLLRGVPLETAPYLLGYVSTKAKPGAELLLYSEKGEPILARWRAGLGTTAVWTSDLKNRWAVEWVRWKAWGRLWSQLVRDMMRQVDTDGLALHSRVSPDGEASVSLDAVAPDDRWRNGLQPLLALTGPDGGVKELALEQRAAGRYEARFQLPTRGSYQLKARASRDSPLRDSLRASLSRPSPAEHLATGDNRLLLERLSTVTNGPQALRPENAFEHSAARFPVRRELRSSLFLTALALFLLDLLLRRVRLGRARPLPFS